MPATPAVGDLIDGKYRLLRVLGQGAVGCVFEATHELLGDRVAIKFLQSDAPSSSAIERFLREARVVRAIQSPHAVKVFEVGQLEGGSPYTVMERLQGSNLAELLRSCGPLPLAQVAELLIEACDGLAEAHRDGVVHRDLKPENLFLCQNPDGTRSLKVLDFGVAKMLSPAESVQLQLRTAGAIGTPLFMSPEQIQGLEIDARSDVWALGVLIFHLLSEHFPFESPTFEGLAVQICTAEHRPLEDLMPGLPAGVLGLVRGCLEKSPSARVASVADVASALMPHAPPRCGVLVERVGRLLGPGPVPGEVRGPVLIAQDSPQTVTRIEETGLANTAPEQAISSGSTPDPSPAPPPPTRRARPWLLALPLALLSLLGWFVMPGRGSGVAPSAPSATPVGAREPATAPSETPPIAGSHASTPAVATVLARVELATPSARPAVPATLASPRSSAPRPPPPVAPASARPASDPKQASIRDRK